MDVTTTLVRCGEWDTQTEIEPAKHQDRYANAFRTHPEFSSRSLANDLALIFLQEEFNLATHIDTVCLPKYGENFDDERCWVTGWGRDVFG